MATTSQPVISVILPTHNPDPARFAATMRGLMRQTLPASLWELVIVDNRSTEPVTLPVGLNFASPPSVIQVSELGLTAARLGGFAASRAALIVMVDDDNVLDPDYLRHALAFAAAHPAIGTFGGKSLPAFEAAPPEWFDRAGLALGCRDRGDAEQAFIPSPAAHLDAYPAMSPIGAGMVLRREVAEAYREALVNRSGAQITDRRGNELSSGGDCDIVLCGLRAGWGTAYTPALSLRHLIPPGRLTIEYLARLSYDSNRSWTLLLDLHGIRPWPAIAGWSVPARKLKAWLAMAAWRSPENSLRWRGACGRIDAQALLTP